MKPQTCMLISGIVNIIHAPALLLSILALLGIGSLGLIASVDGIHGLVGLTMLVVAVPLLLGLAVTIAAIVLAFKSRERGGRISWLPALSALRLVSSSATG